MAPYYNKRMLMRVIFLFVAFSLVSARDYECDPRYEDDGFQVIQPLPYGNIGTIASKISNDSVLKESIRVLSTHMEILRKQIHEYNKTGNATTERCTGGSDGVIKDRARVYGFREPELECQTHFTEEGTEVALEPERKASVLISAIESLSNGFSNFGEEIVRNYNLDWKNVYGNDIFNLESKEDTIRRCTGFRAIGYRVNGTWAIGAKIYDKPWDVGAGSRERVSVTEFLTFDNDQIYNQKLRIPFCDENLDATNFTETNAIIMFEDGTVSWEHGHGADLSEHYGIKLNLAKSVVDKELVQDSGALSNAAVLLLPVFLTLLPLGLFQEVSLSAAVVYSIATDLISVTPVLIKGFELLITGNRKYFSVLSKIYGSSTRNEPGFVQIWPSVCTVDPRIRRTGIIFLSIGFTAMIIGIILEVLSTVAIRRAKKKHSTKVRTLIENDASPDFYDDPSRGAGLLWYWNNKKLD